MKKLIFLCLIMFGGAAAVTVFAEDSAFDELSQAVKKKTVERMASNQKPQKAAKDSKAKDLDCAGKDAPSEACKTEKPKH